VGGLEVKHTALGWVRAPPIESALLVNLGDLAARWTEDQYQSTWHRVHNGSHQDRYSVPFFCNCDFDSPVHGIRDDTLAAAAAAAAAGTAPTPKYAPITAGAYIMEKLGLMRDRD
jgi:isopenicillin N synthase-like dioxygenase